MRLELQRLQHCRIQAGEPELAAAAGVRIVKSAASDLGGLRSDEHGTSCCSGIELDSQLDLDVCARSDVFRLQLRVHELLQHWPR